MGDVINVHHSHEEAEKRTGETANPKGVLVLDKSVICWIWNTNNCFVFVFVYIMVINPIEGKVAAMIDNQNDVPDNLRPAT